MKAEEAQEGRRVYENECGKQGSIIYIDRECNQGCDVEFDDGEYTWIEFDSIELLEEENK